MSAVIHQCEKAIFPFTAKSADWQAMCLSVSTDQKVRVVRREASSTSAESAPFTYEWCVAQTEDGAFGLLPSLVLQRAGEDESFALTPSASPSKALAGIGGATTDGAAPSRRASVARQHFDPFAFDLSSDDGDAGDGTTGAKKKTDKTAAAAAPAATKKTAQTTPTPLPRRTTARPSELPAAAPSRRALNDSHVTVSSSTDDSSRLSSDSENDSVCSFERCPGVLAAQSAPARALRKPVRVSAAEAVAARKKAARAALRKAAPAPTSAPAVAVAEVDQMAQLREVWAAVEAECAWMQSETQPAIEQAIAAAEAEYAVIQQDAARKAALVEKKQAAVAVQAAAQRALATEAQSLLAALEAATEAEGRPASGTSAAARAGIGRRLFNEVDPNTATAGAGAMDKTLLDLVGQESQTLASYAAQEAKLRTRQARATGLLAALRAESELLGVSEDALGALLAEGVDYEVVPAETSGAVPKDAPPVRVVMSAAASAASGFTWPRALSGLTAEEQAVLDNYVRLADKYDAKGKQEAGRAGNAFLDVDLETGACAGGGGENGETTPSRVAKLRTTLAKGDMEVAKLRDDLSQLHEFVATYEPMAAQIEEQIAIGTRVLKQKEADIRRLQEGKAGGVRL